MPRVKGGYVTRRRRNRILKLAKGYFGSKHTLYKSGTHLPAPQGDIHSRA